MWTPDAVIHITGMPALIIMTSVVVLACAGIFAGVRWLLEKIDVS